MSKIIGAGIRTRGAKQVSMADIPDDQRPNRKGLPEHSVWRTGLSSFADAGSIIEEAKGKASRHILEAKQKASDIERKAYEQAFAQGEKAGMEIGRKKAESLIDGFCKIIEELSALRENIYEQSENELVKLALAVSRSVIHQELTTNYEVVVNTVKAALQKAVGTGGIKIRLSPLDMEFARQSKPGILAATQGAAHVTLEEDLSILRGGCIVETDFGDIDASIESQIAELDKALRSSLGSLEG